MAQYIFVKLRDSTRPEEEIRRIENVCEKLTPHEIRGDCSNCVSNWPGCPGGYYGIQNCDGIPGPIAGKLVIGWIAQNDSDDGSINNDVELVGSYAIIKAHYDSVSFFSDQLGSRTLWYYFDEHRLVVSTSQRAIVRFKGTFLPNQSAVAWFISSGCQGPFISWDEEIQQVKPNLEYLLNVATWNLESRLKTDITFPKPGSISSSEYVEEYESNVTQAILSIVKKHRPGQVLLPLSGGLDSRLLLALSRKAGVENQIQPVNWGEPQTSKLFDDKLAAKRVSMFYGKFLLDLTLPSNIEDYDNVFDRFVEASEGRIDHFNAYTDGFSMWDAFHYSGFRCTLRGDVPFPTASYIDEPSAREQLGLMMFEDYVNCRNFVGPIGLAQVSPDVARQDKETQTQWRDRLYVSYRIPMVVSAFTDLVSGHLENYSPMMNWALLRNYMGLSDSEKGDKKHIVYLWKKHDKSNVPLHAVSSLRTPVEFFYSVSGHRYLVDYLVSIRGHDHLPMALLDAVNYRLVDESYLTNKEPHSNILKASRAWLSARVPSRMKGYIKARRQRVLSPHVLAYRLVLADKIIELYTEDAGGFDSCVTSNKAGTRLKDGSV